MNYFFGFIIYTLISLAITSFVPLLIRYAIWREPIRNKWVAGMITVPSFFIGGILGGLLNKGSGFFGSAVGSAIGSAVISYGILRAGIDTPRISGIADVPEVGKNDEFIKLLKSTVSENRLDIIPNDELIEICKRARLVNAQSKKPDNDLIMAVKKLSEEIKNRGLY